MSFVLHVSPTYEWPIQIEIPTDGGKHSKFTFDGVFARLPQSRLKEISKLIEKGEIDDEALAREVLVGWPEGAIKDKDGDDVPFSDSAMDKLMEISKAASAVVTAFYASLDGAKRKN